MFSKIIPNNIFALATDTIWGIACDAESKDNVKKIFELKKREINKAITLFVNDIEFASKIQEIPQELKPWINNFWPGALTLVSKSLTSQFSHCHPKTNFIGIRVPNHKFCLNLLKNINKPLAVSSLNISGSKPLKTKEEIETLFPKLKIFGETSLSKDPSIVIKIFTRNKTLEVLRGEKRQILKLKENLPKKWRINHGH